MAKLKATQNGRRSTIRQELVTSGTTVRSKRERERLESASGAACTEILKVVNETLPFDKASYILDMGCGNGQVISRVFDSETHAALIPDNARLVAADVSQQFLDLLLERKKERSKNSSLWERLEVHRWDARGLKDQIQDGERRERSTRRSPPPGGVFVETSMGFTRWGHLPQLIKQLKPDIVIPGPAVYWGSVEGLTKTLSSAGFNNVSTKEFEVTLPLEKYEDAIHFVFEGFPFMKGLLADMSSDEVQQIRELMLEYVKQRHPEEPFRLTGKGYVGYGMK